MIKRSAILFIFAFILFVNFSSARVEGYCVNAEVTSINPVSVGGDEEFEVGILIDNCGTKLPENIVFEITRHSSNIRIKEPLVTTIGKMGYTNSRRFLVFHMTTEPDIAPGIHTFETKLNYGNDRVFLETRDNFSITVNTNKPDLAISGIYTRPEFLFEGDTATITIDIQNSGKGGARDVRVILADESFIGVKTKYLGKIESSETVPARFILQSPGQGNYKSNILVQYTFAGEVQNIEFPIEFEVFKRDKNYFLYSILILIIVLLGFLIFRFLNPKK